jgi:ribosomal protein S18 acetylase RimI-like enzyme
VLIRAVRPADLPELVRLCAEHAAYERADPPAPGLAARLATAFAGPDRWGLVADADGLVGYATVSREYDLDLGWYAHMDCLYLDGAWRDRGIGARLLAAVRAGAAERGLRTVRWQTPDWNTDAIRFYDRRGGGTPMTQLTLAVGATW